ncbi:MAG: OsmC family protein, partial [Rhodospirillales bacterium]|nr:OsmC family protein [Rhodospirillales bacterium]
MDASELRALQAPIKQRYRDDPASAQVPARAEARLDPDAIACTIPSWHGEIRAGLHRAAGGDGTLACSGDMLLEALAACAGVTLRAVATAMGITIRGGRVIVEGMWDARGTLGIDRTAPVGLSAISLRFELDTDAPADKQA